MMRLNPHDTGNMSNGNVLPINTANMSNGFTPQPPIQEAVNTAFDRSDAASQVDPQLVAQITEQVVRNLQASGITGGMSYPTSSQMPVHTPQPGSPHLPAQSGSFFHPMPVNGVKSGIPGSPTSLASSHVPPRYTPPSPYRPEPSSRGSSSPDRSSDSASHTSTSRTNSRRDSKNSVSGPDDSAATRSRPRPVRVPSAVEETPIEKKWGRLFEDGKPTVRLSQFLRGLAKHIIEDCEPKQSIVITPGKMVDFFAATKVTNEIYPWRAIFEKSLTNISISRMFRELRCQHHFVQFNPQDPPCIPGLTPQGFEVFMTTLIKAHPDHEFERLAKAVLDMPISNADDGKERYPKELPRRLLPKQSDMQQQQRLEAAFTLDPAIQLPNKSTMPPPPSSQPPNRSTSSSFSEGQRSQYSGAYSSALDDDELSTTPVPIERERKPYTGREGERSYNNNEKSNSGSVRPESSSSRAPQVPSANRTAPQSIPQQSRPTDIPSAPQTRAHRMSMGAGPPGGRYGTSPATVPNVFTRSEGTNVGDIPAYYHASNIHGDPLHDDPPRNPRRFRRQNTDEDVARGFGIPVRQGSQYDYPSAGSHSASRGPGGSDGYGSFPSYVPPPPPGPRY